MTDLLAPVLDPGSRTYWPLCLLALAIAGPHHLIVHRRRPRAAWRTLIRATFAPHLWRQPSAWVDLQLVLVRRSLVLLAGVTELGLTYAFATRIVRALDAGLGIPAIPALHPLLVTVVYTAALFIVWDLSRYLLHRWMHENPLLWEFHQVHHSAEVLTPLTFHRVHPVEGLLYGARGVLVDGALAGLAFWLFRGAAVQWTILGVHGVGFLMNAISGNLRHSHVWWRFGPRVERWLLSPAQHQLHHALDQDRYNFGTWLSVWDRMAGSLALAPPRPPRTFGLREPNHSPSDVLGALVGPFRAVARRLAPSAVLAALGIGGKAGAQEAEEPPAYEIVVTGEEGVPRAAGSAYVLDEEDLERFGYDDVHQVLASVPGVYVRGEDGFGLRPNIGMRGANSDRSEKIALLEDGIPLAPAPYAAPAAYYFPLVTRMVGVEVFKGPAALEHGPQTIGGAVNLLTRPVPRSPAGAVDLSAGHYETLEAHAWGGLGTERVGVLLEAMHLSSGGFKELDGGGPTGFQRQDLLFKARAASAPGDVRGSVELKIGYGRERSHETYLGLSYADWERTPYRRYAASQDDLMRWDRTQAELFGDFAVGRTRVDAAAWTHGFSRVWSKLNGFAGGPDLRDLLVEGGGGPSDGLLDILRGEQDSATADQELLIGTNDRRYRSSGAQSVLRTTIGRGKVEDRLTIGVRVLRDDVRRVHTEDPFDMLAGELVPTGASTETTLDSATRAEALAAWIHDDLDLGRFQVLPGARVEWIRTSAGTTDTGPTDPQTQVAVLPGIGLFGEASPWLDLFAGVHRGFSPVGPGQAADVRPETALNYEAGVRARPGEWRLEGVGYLSQYQNVVGTCTLSGGCDQDQLDQQFNGGEALVYGVEVLGEHVLHLPARWDVALNATYTWTHSRFLTGFVSDFPQFGTVVAGDALPYVPEHQGSARLDVQRPRCRVSVGASARSGMRDEAGQGPFPEVGGVPPLLLVDAAGEVAITPTIRLYTTLTNLTGTAAIQAWQPAGARPIAPFRANLGVRIGR